MRKEQRIGEKAAAHRVQKEVDYFAGLAVLAAVN